VAKITTVQMICQVFLNVGKMFVHFRVLQVEMVVLVGKVTLDYLVYL